MNRLLCSQRAEAFTIQASPRTCMVRIDVDDHVSDSEANQRDGCVMAGKAWLTSRVCKAHCRLPKTLHR